MNQENTQPSGALIGAMRESGWTMRSIASIVILTFGGLVTSPAVAAVKLEAQKIQWHKAEEGHGAKLSAQLLAIRDHLAATTRKNLKGTSLSDERKQFKDEAAALADLDQQTLGDFASTRAMIKDKHLPDVIMQREAAAETHYKTEMAALRQGLDTVANEKDDAKAQADSKYVLDRLSKFQMERSQQKFDPKNLPNRSLKPDLTRKPFTTKKQFAEAGFIGNPRLMVATTAPNFDYSQLPGANNPAYLAATTEVTLSPAIQAQAAALNYNPVQIYNWVRNNIQWQPTWGAVQDADLTLSAQRGNAFDISSLLIALLRASNIPARYVLGTINVPADKFRNWMGGFQNINAAVNYASAGGIPITSLYAGGQITTIQMQHIWVEAAIDYIPSHGAINKSADSWVPMDASYKQYTFKQGLDAIAISGTNMTTLTNNLLTSGTIDQQNSSISGMNASIVQNAAQNVQSSVQSYISQNLPNASAEDILGGRDIIPSNPGVLSASLPNSVVVVGTRYGSLPSSIEQSISFSLGVDALGNPSNSIDLPWAQLNNQQVTLSFDVATASDEQALKSLLPTGQITDVSQLSSSVPAYLINVVPELKVNGKIVLTGNPMTLGQDLTFVFTPEFVGRQAVQNTYDVIAGSYLDASVIAGNVSPQILTAVQNRIQQTESILATQDLTQIQNLTHEELLGDMFQAGMLDYFAQYSTLADIMGQHQNGYFYLAGGIGTFGYEPHVDYSFGIPTNIRDGGAVMNVPIINAIGVDDQNKAKLVSYAYQVGAISSELEASVPEQIFYSSTGAIQAASAASIIGLANQQGQKIYTLTQSNIAQLAQITINDSARQEISDSLANGMTVVVNESPVDINGWIGSGYMVLDPQTGNGAYKISGGTNGGYLSLSLIPDWVKELFWSSIGELGGVVGKAITGLKSLYDNVKTLIQLINNCSPQQEEAAVVSIALLMIGFSAIFPAFLALGALAAIIYSAFASTTVALVSEGWVKSCKPE